MQIGLIGGLDRNEERYAQMARARGHELVCHTGKTAGRGQNALATLIERSALVVVQTDVNSHGAVRKARELARELGRPLLLVKRFGVTALSRLLDDLESEQHKAQSLKQSARPTAHNLAERAPHSGVR